MKKVYVKQLEALGFIRCPSCGFFKPMFIDAHHSRTYILGIPIGKITRNYTLRCDGCKKILSIAKEDIASYKNKSAVAFPYEMQKKVWRQIYLAHKYLNNDDSINKDLEPFFTAIKKEAKMNIPFEISNEQFNYIFNAYLTNLTKVSKNG